MKSIQVRAGQKKQAYWQEHIPCWEQIIQYNLCKFVRGLPYMDGLMQHLNVHENTTFILNIMFAILRTD